MTTTSRLDTTDLAIQKGVRDAEDKLVIAIQDALNTTDYGKSGNDTLEESQFRNLVRVSDSTESVEVIKNFLRYQVGRDKKWGRGDKSLANKIISDIDGMIFDKAKKITEGLEDAKRKQVHLELVRRYLGYGARHLKYLRDGK